MKIIPGKYLNENLEAPKGFVLSQWDFIEMNLNAIKMKGDELVSLFDVSKIWKELGYSPTEKIYFSDIRKQLIADRKNIELQIREVQINSDIIIGSFSSAFQQPGSPKSLITLNPVVTELTSIFAPNLTPASK